MSQLPPIEASSVDVIQSIINEPSKELSDESIKVLFNKITSTDGLVRAQALEALTLALERQYTAWFESVLESLLHSTQAREVCNGLAVLSAILSISEWQAGRLLQTQGFFSRLAKSVVELAALDKSPPDDADLNRYFSEFLAQCLDHKSLCVTIRSEWPECLAWLTGISLAADPTSVSIPARCGASLAFVKLPASDQLADIMLMAFLRNENPPNSAMECLALLSKKESVLEILRNKSEDFFQTTKSLSRSVLDHEPNLKKYTPSPSIASGLATVILNLVSFKVLPTDLQIDEKTLEQQESRRKRTQADQWGSYYHRSSEDRENEKYDREVLNWLRSTLERNSDFIETFARLSKTGDGSQRLEQITTKIWLNLVEYEKCAKLIFKHGSHETVMDIINNPKFSEYLSRQEPPDPASTEPKAVANSGNLVLKPHELEMIQVLAQLTIHRAIPSSGLDEYVERSMVKLLIMLFLHPSSTEYQTYLALTAIPYCMYSEGAKAEVSGCSQLLARLDELMISDFSRMVMELMSSLIDEPAYIKRFSPSSPSDPNQADTAHIERLQNLFTLIADEDLELSAAAVNVFESLTSASSEICQSIVSDGSLTESLLVCFHKSAGRDRDTDGWYRSIGGGMCGAFQNIYDNLPSASDGDPPQLFVDERLHDGLEQIDDYCEEGMEHGDFKDCRDLQEETTRLSKCIVDQFHHRKKFKHYHLNEREPADYDRYH